MICCNKHSNFYFLNYKYVLYLNSTHSEEPNHKIYDFVDVYRATTILSLCFSL